jgi:hypothetical protein
MAQEKAGRILAQSRFLGKWEAAFSVPRRVKITVYVHVSRWEFVWPK